MVYAVLNEKGIDTKGMTPDVAIKKFNELNRSVKRSQGTQEERTDGEKLKNRFNSGRGGKIPPPEAHSYGRPATKHHLKHAKDMGLTEREYRKYAIKFFNEGNGVLQKDRNGDFYKYDKESSRICICNPKGEIKTFYPLSSKGWEKLRSNKKLEDI